MSNRTDYSAIEPERSAEQEADAKRWQAYADVWASALPKTTAPEIGSTTPQELPLPSLPKAADRRLSLDELVDLNYALAKKNHQIMPGTTPADAKLRFRTLIEEARSKPDNQPAAKGLGAARAAKPPSVL